ncbi:MAG: nucleotide exchange factor GrpE [Limnospira sp.]
MDENKQQNMVSDPMTDRPEENTESAGAAPSDPEPVNSASTPTEPESPAEPPAASAEPSAGETDRAATAEVAEDLSAQLNEELLAMTQINESLKAQLDDISGQYRRLAADFENFRKRTQKEKEELDVHVKCATIQQLLPVIDNFERARSQIKPQNDGEMNIHKSYQGVYKQMVDCLKQLGVSPMRPEGEPFDPNLHEAVMREATADHPEGTVIEELMRGYMLGDRVLRHAMVKVSIEPEFTGTATEEEPPAEEAPE